MMSGFAACLLGCGGSASLPTAISEPPSPDLINPSSVDSSTDEQVLGFGTQYPFAHPNAAPTNLSATVTQDGTCILEWVDHTPDEVGYQVEKSVNGGHWQALQLVDADVVALVDNTLTAGNDYCYRVRAYSMSDVTAYSKEACVSGDGLATDQDSGDLGINDLKLVTQADGSVSMTWLAAPDTVDVIVQRMQEGQEWQDHALVSGNDGSFIDSEQMPETSYCYRLGVVDDTGSVSYTASVCMEGFSDSAATGEEKRRWVRVPNNFVRESDDPVASKTDNAIEVVKQAAAAGCNGVVIAEPKFFTITKYNWDKPGGTWRENVERLLAVCEAHDMELIPTANLISHGSPYLAYDPNMVAGYEVRNSKFVVHSGIARLSPDPTPVILNPGFEMETHGDLTGWSWRDKPDEATIIDTNNAHSGKASMRFEASNSHLGMCRTTQQFDVTPRRRYRLTAYVRTNQLTPSQCFQMYIRTGKEDGYRTLTFESRSYFGIESTQDWKQISIVFNSLEYDSVQLLVGIWGVESGQFWIDDVAIEEIGLVNVLRRDGCPFTVTSVDGQQTYVEGVDFAEVRDPLLGQAKWAGTYDRFHEAPDIEMLKTVPDGTELSVSFYHPMLTGGEQADCCMTEPRVHELFRENLRRMHDVLGQRSHYFLTLNELRTGGGCARCQATGKTPGQLLADNVRTFISIIREESPGAEIVIWADMFHPDRNARDQYYLMQGTLEGSWEGLDSDVIVCPWGFGLRDKVLPFFADRGHRQLISANFGQTLKHSDFVEQWKTSIDATPDVIGAMYTTWGYDYSQLDQMQAF